MFSIDFEANTTQLSNYYVTVFKLLFELSELKNMLTRVKSG